ncbi:MAG: hypothetical protein M3P18_15065 [Actinomycetota bacterium]|nr:hypothetical protein [Actinomycetota bacterium]
MRQFWVLPIAATMGRPQKTLLERVLAGSFRADRYASLLDGELLPATSPFSDRRRRRLWQRLREEQRAYQDAVDSQAFSAERKRAWAARSFSRLVLGLHGGKLPWWLEEKRKGRPSRGALDRALRRVGE